VKTLYVSGNKLVDREKSAVQIRTEKEAMELFIGSLRVKGII
jgi:hypothetical protein